MSKRYFKATDGTRTAFRSTATRVYRSASISEHGISFSALPPSRLPTDFPAVEIDKQEYDRLAALKKFRIEAGKLTGAIKSWQGDSPQDSWVCNKDLPCK